MGLIGRQNTGNQKREGRKGWEIFLPDEVRIDCSNQSRCEGYYLKQLLISKSSTKLAK